MQQKQAYIQYVTNKQINQSIVVCHLELQSTDDFTFKYKMSHTTGAQGKTTCQTIINHRFIPFEIIPYTRKYVCSISQRVVFS